MLYCFWVVFFERYNKESDNNYINKLFTQGNLVSYITAINVGPVNQLIN